MRRRRLLLALLVVALLAAACGDSDDDAEGADAESPVSTTTVSSTSPSTTTLPLSTTTTSPPSTTSEPVEEVVVGGAGTILSVGGDPDPVVAVDPKMANGAGPNPAFGEHVLAVAGTEADGPVYMVNLNDFADTAHYPEDSEFFGSTGAEANERYLAVAQPTIAALGGEVVFGGTVRRVVGGGDDIGWDQIAIMRYPNRQAILALQADDAFQDALEHKYASLDHTLAIATETIPVPELPPVDPATTPHPPTDDDAPFVMFHVINFHEEAVYEPGEEPDDAPISGREAVARYSANAGTVAFPLGVRPDAWFEVIHSAITDGREWDEVRLNRFPSGAAFEALTSDPQWAAGAHHRVAGIEDTYAIMVTPAIWRPDLITG